MPTTPSQAELAILKYLWSAGPQSAREVQNAIAAQHGWSYSTTRTLLLRMTKKQLIRRKDMHGLAVFAAKATKVAVMGALIKEFAAKTLDLDGPIEATAFSSSKLFSKEEAAELEQLLSQSADDEGRS
ncbi:BlaI/MecI/CopY family transcriptional regulator [Hyphobacterium sp.]|uniref:BlaI/MecI/CopY family transcriptional regulator n=1 Tax=Hyphobacterium sp. TaxID=2004662 RepID=UPI003BA8499C